MLSTLQGFLSAVAECSLLFYNTYLECFFLFQRTLDRFFSTAENWFSLCMFLDIFELLSSFPTDIYSIATSIIRQKLHIKLCLLFSSISVMVCFLTKCIFGWGDANETQLSHLHTPENSHTTQNEQNTYQRNNICI